MASAIAHHGLAPASQNSDTPRSVQGRGRQARRIFVEIRQEHGSPALALGVDESTKPIALSARHLEVLVPRLDDFRPAGMIPDVISHDQVVLEHVSQIVTSFFQHAFILRTQRMEDLSSGIIMQGQARLRILPQRLIDAEIKRVQSRDGFLRILELRNLNRMIERSDSDDCGNYRCCSAKRRDDVGMA
jgi:hypothetical protein